MKDKFSIVLSTMGIIAILCTLFIWLWLATMFPVWLLGGKEGCVELLIMVVLGVFPGVVGIGILRRHRWSRVFLMIFWFIISSCIIGLNISNLQDSIGNLQPWLAEVIPWLFVALIGILHIIFLKHNRVKELFKKE